MESSQRCAGYVARIQEVHFDQHPFRVSAPLGAGPEGEETGWCGA